MKKTIIGLLVSVLVIGCGGNGSGTESPSQVDELPKIEGDGTLETPYIVGNGKYNTDGTEYFKIKVNHADCNIIVYDIKYLDYVYGPILFKSNFDNLGEPDGNNLYKSLEQGEYVIKVDPWMTHKTAEFGIFSPCVENIDNSTFPTGLGEGRLKIEKTESMLYKIVSDVDRTMTVNIIDGSGKLILYSNNLLFKDKKESYQSNNFTLQIEKGENYIYVINNDNYNSFIINVSY